MFGKKPKRPMPQKGIILRRSWVGTDKKPEPAYQIVSVSNDTVFEEASIAGKRLTRHRVDSLIEAGWNVEIFHEQRGAHDGV